MPVGSWDHADGDTYLAGWDNLSPISAPSFVGRMPCCTLHRIVARCSAGRDKLLLIRLEMELCLEDLVVAPL